MKWVEAKSLYVAIENGVVEFPFEGIFNRFGVPWDNFTNHGTQFTAKLFKNLTEHSQIKHWKSTPYKPQPNGQVECTNKVLESILTNVVQLHHKDWFHKLLEALWAYHVTWRNVIGHAPYELVYGKHVLFPIEFQVKTFQNNTQLRMNLNESHEQRLMRLNELDDIIYDAFNRTMLLQG